ncbi:MAG: phosphoadenosine phosphosulfate reductase family protein, partial [Verrucomicrobiota bacterium]
MSATATTVETASTIPMDVVTRLEGSSAEERIRYAIENWGIEQAVTTTSFGVQAAVLLHLLHRCAPGIRVIFIDTGYHFPETLAYGEQLESQWNLNVLRYRAAEEPSEQERIYGRLWEQGADGLDFYNLLNKVQPMENALSDLQPKVWFSGLRRVQSSTR